MPSIARVGAVEPLESTGCVNGVESSSAAVQSSPETSQSDKDSFSQIMNLVVTQDPVAEESNPEPTAGEQIEITEKSGKKLPAELPDINPVGSIAEELQELLVEPREILAKNSELTFKLEFPEQLVADEAEKLPSAVVNQLPETDMQALSAALAAMMQGQPLQPSQLLSENVAGQSSSQDFKAKSLTNEGAQYLGQLKSADQLALALGEVKSEVAPSDLGANEFSGLLLEGTKSDSPNEQSAWLSDGESGNYSFAAAELRSSKAIALPQLQLTTPVYQPDWAEQFKGKIQWLMDQQVSGAKIILDPPELGSVQVDISHSSELTQITFTVATPAIKDLLEANLARLKSVLPPESGANVQVDVRQQQHQQQSQGFFADSTLETQQSTQPKPVRTSAIESHFAGRPQGLLDHYV